MGFSVLHLIPAGMIQIFENRDIVLENMVGPLLILGIILGIVFQKDGGNVLETKKPTVKIEEAPLPVYRTAHVPEFNYFESNPIPTSMTMDPTLHYPQFYSWNNMDNLHCTPMPAVTQLEQTLITEYPFIPQKTNMVLQSFPQYSIPSYVNSCPQITPSHKNSFSDYNNIDFDVPTDSQNPTLLSGSNNIVVVCFVIYNMFLGTKLSERGTSLHILSISPYIILCLNLQHVCFAFIIQRHGRIRDYVFSLFWVHLSFPVTCIVLAVLQFYQIQWRQPVTTEFLASLLLISGGCLMYLCILFTHTQIKMTRENIYLLFAAMMYCILITILGGFT
jgi:hypothetical protein